MSRPIDAVITWVDGDDPAFRARRESHTPSGSNASSRNDVAAPTRYSSIGEIYWCVSGIRKFAPFVRKIFIVTDGQDPGINGHIPDLDIPVEIVDHKVIFKGYEEYLPVFNSLAIETMLWRIPGLSEDFIYLNDDFFITAPVSESDWFDAEGRPVVYGFDYSIFTARVARRLNWLLKGRKVVKFRDTMLQAALLPGLEVSDFIRLQHLPLSMKKSLFEDYFAQHPEAIIHNIRHRFRDISQYNPQELNYLLARKKFGLKPVGAGPLLVTMGPSGDHRFQRRFNKLVSLPSVKYLCANSMDMMTDSQRYALSRWLDARMSVEIS